MIIRDSDLENEAAAWKEDMDETEILDEYPDSALQPWNEHSPSLNSPIEDARTVTNYPVSKLSVISKTASNESANNLVIAMSESEKEGEEEEESNDEDSRRFLGRSSSDMERKPENDDKLWEGEASGEASGRLRAEGGSQQEVSYAQSMSSACGKGTLEEGKSGREETQKDTNQSSEIEDRVSNDFEMGQKMAEDFGVNYATQTSIVGGKMIKEGNEMPVVAGAEIEGNEEDVSTQIPQPVKPSNYCHKAVDRGWCDRSICRFRHEVSSFSKLFF